MHISLNWVNRVQEEFYMQGDKEKALGLTPLALFDRRQRNDSKSQVCLFLIEFQCVPTVNHLFSQFLGCFCIAQEATTPPSQNGFYKFVIDQVWCVCLSSLSTFSIFQR